MPGINQPASGLQRGFVDNLHSSGWMKYRITIGQRILRRDTLLLSARLLDQVTPVNRIALSILVVACIRRFDRRSAQHRREIPRNVEFGPATLCHLGRIQARETVQSVTGVSHRRE
jgi:hypothetical protein